MLKLSLPVQRVWVRSLVRELRSHMPHDQKTKTQKKKQHYNKFNEDLKHGTHGKKEEEKLC